MGILRYRFAAEVDEPAWRARLRDEIGRRRAGERNVETAWIAPRTLEVLSQDGIALVYARKVSEALGGEPVAPTRPRPLPEWTAARWVELPLLRRLQLWLGPTQP